MTEDEINELLSKLSQQERPNPPDLRREVRADISRRLERPTFWTRVLPVLNWSELLLQPRIAVLALVFAVSVGAIPRIWSPVPAPVSERAAYARQSLHLDVFENVEILPEKPLPTRERLN
ncbi:MAG: hypothetical protein R3F07_04145 [Opitutaceae bacterium]